MSSKLNNNLLMQSSAAALMIIAGVVVKNSGQMMGLKKQQSMYLGLALFVGGWIYCAYMLSLGRKNQMMYILPCIGILVSAVMMRMHMDKGKMPPMMLPAIFALSWLMLGYAVGMHKKGMMQYLGLIASVLVLVSMMVVLPMQRKQGIVDGPGLPMFVIAWAIIVYLNSNRSA